MSQRHIVWKATYVQLSGKRNLTTLAIGPSIGFVVVNEMSHVLSYITSIYFLIYVLRNVYAFIHSQQIVCLHAHPR